MGFNVTGNLSSELFEGLVLAAILGVLAQASRVWMIPALVRLARRNARRYTGSPDEAEELVEEWTAEIAAARRQGGEWRALFFTLGQVVKGSYIELAIWKQQLRRGGAEEQEPSLGKPIYLNQSRYLNEAIKRTLDIALVAYVAFLSLPSLALISLGVLIAARGESVLTSTLMVGRGGRLFKQYKFRTHTGAISPNGQDTLIPVVGSILRRTSIDVLPQLLNVLKGDMSLVGPKAQRPPENYSSENPPTQPARPGITGLAQVSWDSAGYKSDVAHDEFYNRRWSVYLDLWILIRSCWLVIRHRRK